MADKSPSSDLAALRAHQNPCIGVNAQCVGIAWAQLHIWDMGVKLAQDVALTRAGLRVPLAG